MKIVIVYVAIVLLFQSGLFVANVGATDTAEIAIVPNTLTVGEEEGVPTDPFLVNVTITSVADLYSCQVTIFYNKTILNCTDVLFPADHVLHEGMTLKTLEENYAQVGAFLYGDPATAPTFTGDGILCQLKFTGIAEGTSNVEISPYGEELTFLIDSTAAQMEFEVATGEITVVPEFPAFLVVPLLVIATLAAIILRKTLWSRKAIKNEYHHTE